MTMASRTTVLIVGTLDTKYSEIAYLASCITHIGQQVKVLDVGRTPPQASSSRLSGDDIVSPLNDKTSELASLPRGEYIDRAIETCLPVVRELVASQKIQGIVCAGGSSNSSLAAALMRNACPIGFPKLLVSTMASGDIKPYIEETDITMMYSVVDIAGMNSVLKQILGNAAGAICGMATAYSKQHSQTTSESTKRIAISMFGVTTPCVDHIRRILSTGQHTSSSFEIYVFHATGAGGKAMERLITEGQVDAVIDLTTTEVADELFGGVLSAGPDRLAAAAKKGIPTIVSVGACDMVNFGSKNTVPEKYKDRNLYYHNPTVTLMRTTLNENKKIGEFIGNKLKTYAKNPAMIKVVFPEGGISMIDAPGQPFEDRKADEELFKTIGDILRDTGIDVLQYPDHINDEKFAANVCAQLLSLIGMDPKKFRLSNTRVRNWSFDHGRSIAAVRRASHVDVPDR